MHFFYPEVSSSVGAEMTPVSQCIQSAYLEWKDWQVLSMSVDGIARTFSEVSKIK